MDTEDILTLDIKGSALQLFYIQRCLNPFNECMISFLLPGLKEGWHEGVTIATAVFVDVLVTATSDYFQSLQFHKHYDDNRIHVEGIRQGTRLMISISDIVVGDVLLLKAGDQVDKGQKDPFLLSGSEVARGCSTMLVTSVGINTDCGLIMASISDDLGEETPLQVRLNGMATFIGLASLLVAASLPIALLIRYFTGQAKFPNVKSRPGKTKVIAAFDGVIKIFTVAVTIMVVAVPEGLPLALTLILAYSVRKMMTDQVLVRRFSSTETMGSATTICINKSATLTTNEISVAESFVGGKMMEPAGLESDLPDGFRAILMENLAHNTAGAVDIQQECVACKKRCMLHAALEDEYSCYFGSPTVKAMIRWGVKCGIFFDAQRSNTSIIHIFPFNSEKKRGGVAVKSANSDVNIHLKGAAEMMLPSCTTYINMNGEVVPINDERMELFQKSIKDMEAKGLSCVSIAGIAWNLEDIPTDENQLANWELPADDLQLFAILGLKDPCKPGVKNAVQLCTNAGIKVRLVTGDSLCAAKAIALECGIMESNEGNAFELLEGKAFRAMTDADKLQNADKISVMARASPSDKLLLVQMLRKKGNVVAAIGDGWNKDRTLMADVRLAMDIHDTEVAKVSSDIVILDNNLDSAVKVIRWGRSVYKSIQKFCQFHLTVSIAAVLINVIAALSTGDVPLSAVQLLWVNLIKDTFGALSLGMEEPSDNVMQRPPIDRREPVITSIMWMNIIVQVTYQVTASLVLNFQASNILPYLKQYSADHALEVTRTLVFNAFVFCQVFNLLNARNPFGINVFKGMMKAYKFLLMICAIIGLQVIIIMFLGKFFSTVRLSPTSWFVSVIVGFISYPLDAVFKLMAGCVRRTQVFLSTAGKSVLTHNLTKCYTGKFPEDSSNVEAEDSPRHEAEDDETESSPLRGQDARE